MLSFPKGAAVAHFDRRAIQHLLGFWGLSIILIGVAAAFHSWIEYAVHAVVLSFVALAAWLVWMFQNTVTLSSELDTLARVIRSHGTIYLVCALVMAAGIRITSPRWTIILGALFCVSISLSWESIQQPLIDVYGAPARHTIQMDQLAADLLGIALATATRWMIAPRSPAWATSAPRHATAENEAS